MRKIEIWDLHNFTITVTISILVYVWKQAYVWFVFSLKVMLRNEFGVGICEQRHLCPVLCLSSHYFSFCKKKWCIFLYVMFHHWIASRLYLWLCCPCGMWVQTCFIFLIRHVFPWEPRFLIWGLDKSKG